MKRFSKLVFLLIVIVLSVLCFAGCTKLNTVTFQNGNVVIAKILADKEGNVVEPKIDTAEGVEVEGWYTSADFSTKKFDFSTDKISADTTLYVKLININYTVTYDLGYTLPNNEIPQAPEQATFNIDGTFTVFNQTPVRTGYEFMGWACDGEIYESGQIVQVTKTGNVSLVATWQYRMVTVRFFDNEGVEMEEYTKQIPYGSDVAAPDSSVVPSSHFCFQQVDWDNSLLNVTEDTDYNAIYEYVPTPTHLFEFTINDDYNSYSVAAKGAAFNKAVEGKIALPTHYNGLEVTAIASKGFMGAMMMESIYIPSSYKVIKTEAFSFCKGLKQIFIEEGLTTIEADAFTHIGLVEHFELPKSVNDIHWWAFETLMDAGAYYNYGLSPEEQEIYRNFKFTTAEDGFYKWNKTDKVLYGDEGRQLVYVAHDTETLVVKDTVKEVYPSICYSYYWLNSVTITGTDVVIAPGAFYNCALLETFNVTGSVKQVGTDITVYDGMPVEEGSKKIGAFTGTSLSTVYFPDGLKYLGVETFNTCYFLTEVSLPETIEYIHERAFENNYANSDQIFDDILGIYHSNGLNKLEIRGESPYYYCENNVVLIKKGTAEEGDTLVFYCMDAPNTEYTIPVNVKTLMSKSIWATRNLTTLNIVGAVTEIPQDFCSTDSLVTLNIGNTVKFIRLQAFRNCASLANVTFMENSQLEEIENWSFYDTSIENITFPNTIKKLGNDFINNVKSLNVEEGGLYYCSKDGILFSADEKTLIRYPSGREATSYTVPEGVEIIGSRAFDGCYYLETITMGTDVRVISEEAFVGNFKDVWVDGELTGFLGLKEVIMNENLQEIHNMAFYGCSLLENITFTGPAPRLIDTPLDSVLRNWYHYVNLNHIFTGYNQGIFYEEYQQYLDGIGIYGGMTFTVPEAYLADYYTEWYRHRPENVLGFKNLPTVAYNFEANGGSAVQSLDAFALNDMPLSTKEGQYLLGWFTKSEAEGWGEEVTYPYIYQENDSVTLYAKWSQVEIENGQRDIWAYELKEGKTINVSVPHGRNGVWLKFTPTQNCTAKLTGYEKFMENTIMCDAFYFDRLGMDIVNNTPMVLKYLSGQTIPLVYDPETFNEYYQFNAGTTYYIWFVFVSTIDQDMIFKMSLDFLDTPSYALTVAPAIMPNKSEVA